MKKTQEEIDNAIKVLHDLRAVMPATSYFGDNNHAVIDTQIKVLKGEISKAKTNTLPNWDLFDDVFNWMDGGSSQWLEDAQDDLKTFSK